MVRNPEGESDFSNNEEPSMLRKNLDKYSHEKSTPSTPVAQVGYGFGEDDWQC